MNGIHSVEHALSQLLLPIAQERFQSAWERVQHRLESQHLIAEETRGDFLAYEISKWQDHGRPSRFLRDLVSDCLSVESVLGQQFPEQYFNTHEQLTGTGQLAFEDASSLLSHTNMIARLLSEEHMSCAQVASVLSARRSGFEYNWYQLRLVAIGLGMLPELNPSEVHSLMDEDTTSIPDRYADASPLESARVLAEVGAHLGYPSDLETQLRQFYPDASRYVPAYSVFLHWNTIVAHFYDHPATAAYEFSPRGTLAREMQQDKHPSYTPHESAFLNNSKGTFAFDHNWAWSRDPSARSQAIALADLLTGMSQMAYPARRELASWVRSWLLRIEENYSESRVEVRQPTPEGINNFFEQIGMGNSKTYGILEQRAVDCLSTALVSAENGYWAAHGRGDSVSASNTSKKKLGDVEFKSAEQRRIWAFEAHGGTLVPFYVDIHAATFEDTLPKRKLEFDQLGDPAEWSIRVEFIAHNLNDMEKARRRSEVCGYDVDWTFTTFQELWKSVKNHIPTEQILQAFDEHVTKHIDSRWVSDSVKETFNRFTDTSLTNQA